MPRLLCTIYRASETIANLALELMACPQIIVSAAFGELLSDDDSFDDLRD